jgi:hypothetical protein
LDGNPDKHHQPISFHSTCCYNSRTINRPTRTTEADIQTPRSLVDEDFLLVLVEAGPSPVPPAPPREVDEGMPPGEPDEIIVPIASVLVPSITRVPPLVAREYVVPDAVICDPGLSVWVPITNAENVGFGVKRISVLV